MNETQIQQHLSIYRNAVADCDAGGIVRWALHEFGVRDLVLSSSLSLEDQVLTDMLLEADPEARIFTLDTGRCFPETYQVMQETMERYGMRFAVYAPDARELEDLVREHGPNCFYESVALRQRCCAVRKVNPLRRALAGAAAWMTGLRRAQSVTRTALEPVEWDAAHGLWKISPLWNWTLDAVQAYARERQVPVNALHAKGFVSIGCAPCTRAVRDGEDERGGRWWWENPEKKECGLHQVK